MPPPPPDEPAREEMAQLLCKALSGDAAMQRKLVELLTPAIHVRVAWVLRSRAAAARGRARQEVDDLVQDVWAELLANDARALRSWRPEGGRSLCYFVAWFAGHRARMALRSTRTNPWIHEPTDPPILAEMVPDSVSLDAALGDVELLNMLYERMEETLGLEQLRLFHALWVEERPSKEVCLELGLTESNLWQRRSRLRRAARKLLIELLEK